MRYLFFCLILISHLTLKAQEYAVGLNYGNQLLFEDDDTLFHDYITGFETSYLVNRERSLLDWTQFYHIRHIQYGFIFQNLDHLRGFVDTTSTSNFLQGYVPGLGKLYGLYAAPQISFFKFSSPINLYLNPGFGICYLSKTFYMDKRNRYTGSHLNYLVKMELGVQIKVSAKDGLLLGTRFIHFSNGGMLLPNAGVNQLNTTISYYHKL